MAVNAEGEHVAVEIKRHGGIDWRRAADSLLRTAQSRSAADPVHGIFAAQTITPQAQVLAKDRRLHLPHPRLRRYERHRGRQSQAVLDIAGLPHQREPLLYLLVRGENIDYEDQRGVGGESDLAPYLHRPDPAESPAEPESRRLADQTLLPALDNLMLAAGIAEQIGVDCGIAIPGRIELLAIRRPPVYLTTTVFLSVSLAPLPLISVCEISESTEP